jgi:hypothetical protein
MDSRTATPEDARAVCSLLKQLGYPSGEVAVRRRLAELGDDDLVLLCEGGKGLVALHRRDRSSRRRGIAADRDHSGVGVRARARRRRLAWWRMMQASRRLFGRS